MNPKNAHTLAYLIGQFQQIWSVQTKSLKYLPVCGVLQIKSGTSDRSFWSPIMLEFLIAKCVAGSGRDVTDTGDGRFIDTDFITYTIYWNI